MKTKILVLIAAMLMSLNAFAISLQDAKSQGLVGEQPNGYLGLVVNNQEASAVVKQVNAKRKAKFEQIAKKNAVPVAEVGKLFAEKAIKATKKGHYIQSKSGKWIKK